jgi:sRNA-binding protein
VASRDGVGLPRRADAAEVQSKEDGNPLASSRTQKRNLEASAAEAVIELLAERFPRCFAIYERRRKPLKLKIHLDILAALDGAITPIELGIALRFYTQNVGYLRAMLCGRWRHDLNGNPVGTVTCEEEKAAKAIIALRMAKAASAKAAAELKLQPKRDGLAQLRDAARRRKAGAS